MGIDFYIDKESINDNIINKDCVFPSNKESISFHKMAPILWKKKDIDSSISSQASKRFINNVRFNSESIATIIQKNSKGDAYEYKISVDFYDCHYNLMEIIMLGMSHRIEIHIGILVETFFNICYENKCALTLDKLLIVIADLNSFSLTIKKSYNGKNKFRLESPEQLLSVIKLFFAVIETIYSHEIKETTSQIKEFTYPSPNSKEDIRFFSNVDILRLIKQIVDPFQSYLSENDKDSVNNKSIRNNIPENVHSSLMFAYLAIFPIMEVICEDYCSSSPYGLNNNFFPYREISGIIYKLFRFLPVLNKYELFLSHFAVANRSFINISWFLHILKNYDVNISFFEDILFQTFGNEINYAVKNSYDVDANLIKSDLDTLLTLFSLSTNRVDIYEKLKSISAFYQFKG